MRIGFLLNHDQVHQTAHVIPVAAALARAEPALDLVVAVSSDRLGDEAARLLRILGSRVPVVRLGHRRRGTRLLVRMIDPLLPAGRVGLYRDNLDFFRGLDGLVVPEKTSLALKRRFDLSLPIIHTRHGAGDRAIGFNGESALFDHVLVSGPKIAERLVAEAGVAPARITTVGYPKFDLPVPPADLPFADPTRPVVMYNPHPSPHLSSWFTQGRAVLDYFARSDRYNLIFAPHVMLFHRRIAASIDRLRVARVGTVPRAARMAGNIHIDLGSPASTDMRYTEAADIYLGDVSSQLYEFLRRPRPCLFLNAHGIRPEGEANYAGWRAGRVIDDPALLDDALADARASHPRFLPVQRDLFGRSFDLTAEPSSDRAARAILRVVAGARSAALRAVA